MNKSAVIGLIWSLTCIVGALAAHIFASAPENPSKLFGQEITLPIGVLIVGAPGIFPFFLPYIVKAWKGFRNGNPQ